MLGVGEAFFQEAKDSAGFYITLWCESKQERYDAV
jgi:hypothetical protein